MFRTRRPSSDGSGGHADHRETGGNIAKDGGTGSNADVVPEEGALPHHRAGPDQDPVAAGHAAAHSGIWHHARVLAEGGVVAD